MGLSFHWEAFGIEKMVGEKIVGFSFGGAACPRMRTTSVGASKP